MSINSGECLNNTIVTNQCLQCCLLPICNYELDRRSFVVRCLFNFLTA